MKTKQYVVLFSSVLGAVALSASALGGTANVNWEDPEQYSDLGTDFKDRTNPEHFMKEMERHIERLAQQELPDGAVLSVNVTDVDLAGRVEPERLDDVRIMRDIYPPRMKLSYQLMRDNEVVEEGEASLVDLDYNYNIRRSILNSDPFYHEKEMIDEWMRSEFGS